MIKNMLPAKALQKVKNYLRRHCRKPHDMKVRSYYQHLLRINREELKLLPPFKSENRLSPEELTDIVLFGTPKSWQREMDRQGFDPMEKEITAVIDFLEQIETSEEGDEAKEQKHSHSSKKKPPGNSSSLIACTNSRGDKPHRPDD